MSWPDFQCDPTAGLPTPSPGLPSAASSADCLMRCAVAATPPTAFIPGSALLSARVDFIPPPASNISSMPSSCAPVPPIPIASITIIRFGEHQPLFAKHFLEPALAPSQVAQRIAQHDPRYFTAYYAVEGVHFQPAALSYALVTLDAPYLPLVVLEAAGVPLDPAFAEQK